MLPHATVHTPEAALSWVFTAAYLVLLSEDRYPIRTKLYLQLVDAQPFTGSRLFVNAKHNAVRGAAMGVAWQLVLCYI